MRELTRFMRAVYVRRNFDDGLVHLEERIVRAESRITYVSVLCASVSLW